MEDTAQITAKITGIVFSNRSTGFYVLRVIPEGQKDILTVKGSWPGISIGVGLKAKFTGKYEQHEKFGNQLNAALCDIIPDKGRNGVLNYLIANVKSIGPLTASRMYEAFGDDLLKILDETPEKIMELPFLNRAQVSSILNEWSEASENRTCSIFLSELGLGPTAIKNVLARFGVKDAKSTIATNPYCLTECPGIGFVIADQAARKLDIGVDDPKRVRAMILFIMSELSAMDGHMYCTSNQIKDYANNKLFNKHSVDPFSYGKYISDTHLYSSIVSLQESGHIVISGNNLYTASNWADEHDAAEALAAIIDNGPVDFINLSGILSDFEAEKKLQLSDEQRQAFMSLNDSRVVVISGYPGTGKTLLISAFVYLFEKLNKSYSLLSPTGIAAKLLSQVTSKPASTIHRALGYKHDGTWEYSRFNKYYTDAIVVDEMSMVDAATLSRLVNALAPTTLLIMVGDSAQLPSVGAGYVFHNLMNCDSVSHVALTRIYRQEKLSDIIKVAHSILRNEHIDTQFNKDSEVLFFNYSQDDVVDQICRLTSALKDKAQSFQVMAPVYDGELGVNNLNEELRDVLNFGSFKKDAPMVKQGENGIYEGDRIMVTKNDYDRMIYNGDAGKVLRISLKRDEVEVKIFNWFDQEISKYSDKIFVLKVEEARQLLRVAYACTIHRCQGQQFDYVIMPMTMQYGIMLYKNLIYTAITRARKKVFIFGDPKAFISAANNERETIRNSNLSYLIQECVSLEQAKAVQDS